MSSLLKWPETDQTEGQSRVDSCRFVQQTSSYTVDARPLGRLLLIRLEMAQFLYLPENQWFCSKIVVDTPEEETLLFPCHRWVTRGAALELRGAEGLSPSYTSVLDFSLGIFLQWADLFWYLHGLFLLLCVMIYFGTPYLQRWRRVMKTILCWWSTGGERWPNEVNFISESNQLVQWQPSNNFPVNLDSLIKCSASFHLY